MTFDGIQITHRPQVCLGSGQESLGPEDVYRQTAFNTFDNRGLDWFLLVISLLNLVPGAQALRLLMGKINVSFLGFALIAHHIDFVTRLELGLALVIQHLA